jgi:hypothetical protein
MKKILLIVISFLLFCTATCFAQSYQKTGTSVEIVNNAAVTTAVVIVHNDSTNLSWSICAENGAARCSAGLPSGGAASPVPTTSVGYYISSGTCQPMTPGTNATLEIDCASVSGSDIAISAWINHK